MSLSDDVAEVLRQYGELPAPGILTRMPRRRFLCVSWSPSLAALYGALLHLEGDGRVESRWDEGPVPPARRGARRRLYRLRIPYDRPDAPR